MPRSSSNLTVSDTPTRSQTSRSSQDPEVQRSVLPHLARQTCRDRLPNAVRVLIEHFATLHHPRRLRKEIPSHFSHGP